MLPALLLIPCVLAETLTVGSGGDYSSIGAAIEAAATGDTIQVEPGTYSEDLWVGKNVTIEPAEGVGTVTLDGTGADTYALSMAAGTLRGFVLTGAPEIAARLSGGSVRLLQSTIQNPGTVGVLVSANAPEVTEVLVQGAGTHAFWVEAGSPTLQRCLAIDPAETGYLLASAGSYSNLLAMGAAQGFSLQADDLAISHPAALDNDGALFTAGPAAILDALLSDNALAIDCQGFTVELGYSLIWQDNQTSDCPGGQFHDNQVSSPQLNDWHSGARPPRIDLRAGEGSPLVDSGSDLDLDGTQADIGLFGGPAAGWTDSDGDGFPIHFDCDEDDAGVHHGAPELDDGIDNDCDGEIDEGQQDRDTGDSGGAGPDTGPSGSGDSGQPADTRDLDHDGWSVADGDCADHNLASWPGADEIPDQADNDCDGVVDEGLWYVDDDEDGYTEEQGDCDDWDPERSPASQEQGSDGVDHDCDGTADGDTSQDADGDGFTVGAGDCDDSRAGVHPDAFDGIDGIDGDCDGATDDDGLALDADLDGVTVAGGDCNDGDLSIASGAPELADDGVDQDCDGIDLFDVDGDGDPSPAAGGQDCDDTRSDIYTDADEVCDGLDNDCDGSVDEYCGPGDLDGPAIEPGDGGLRARCNCSGAPGALPWDHFVLLALLSACALRSRRA